MRSWGWRELGISGMCKNRTSLFPFCTINRPNPLLTRKREYPSFSHFPTVKRVVDGRLTSPSQGRLFLTFLTKMVKDWMGSSSPNSETGDGRTDTTLRNRPFSPKECRGLCASGPSPTLTPPNSETGVTVTRPSVTNSSTTARSSAC